ncbi:MAG: sulfotransferase family 2 domain-containing protein [bacterium]
MVGGEEGGRRRRRPTFAEFAAYLLRVPADQYDNHWLPYWLHCHLCRLEYDVIAKMETFAADMDFITGEYIHGCHGSTIVVFSHSQLDRWFF